MPKTPILIIEDNTDINNLVPKNDFQRKMLASAMNGEKIYWSYGLLKKEFYHDADDCNS